MQLTTKIKETIMNKEETNQKRTTEKIKNDRRRKSEEKLNQLRTKMTAEQKKMNESNIVPTWCFQLVNNLTHQRSGLRPK